MNMVKRTIVGVLAAGALVVLVAVPDSAAQGISGQNISGQGTLHVDSCHDAFGGPGGGCPTADGH
jgi:hypothetical protein